MTAFMKEITKIEIEELVAPAKVVFCILTNLNYKILHISQNLCDHLKVSPSFSNHDIFIQEIFHGMPSNFDETPNYFCLLDISPF